MAVATYQGISDFKTAKEHGTLPFLQKELRQQTLMETSVANVLPELASLDRERLSMGFPPTKSSEEELGKQKKQASKEKRLRALTGLTADEQQEVRQELEWSFFSRAPLSEERISAILPEGTTYRDFLSDEKALEMEQSLEAEKRWRTRMDSLNEVMKD